MRRFVAVGLALAATLAAARADVAPPPLELIDVVAGDLIFLVVARDYARPSHPTAELVGCIDGKPNCLRAKDQGLIGRRVVGFDGAAFDPDRDLRSQIVAAFAATAPRRRSRSISSRWTAVRHCKARWRGGKCGPRRSSQSLAGTGAS